MTIEYLNMEEHRYILFDEHESRLRLALAYGVVAGVLLSGAVAALWWAVA